MSNKIGLVGNMKQGLPFIISAPAGAGKTTLVDRLKREFPAIVSSISCTTRAPRGNEVQDVDYHFLSDAEFTSKVKAGEFLEHVELFNHRYGTLKKDVLQDLNKGKHVVLTIDVQGAIFLMDKIEAVFIFIMPPSIDELVSRLEKRGTETKDALDVRLARAQEEMELATEYDYIIVNDDLEIAYQVLKSIFIAEEHRVR